MVRILTAALGDSWKKYTSFLIAILVLINREEIGLVTGPSDATEDLVAILAFAVLAAAYLVGQGLADVGKGAAQVKPTTGTGSREHTP